MIRVKNKFIYLCSASTASRTTANVLLTQCNGVQLSRSHHVTKAELDNLKDYPEPFISTIRDPVEFTLSRYWYRTRSLRNRNLSFSRFLDQFFESMYGNEFGPRSTPYHEYVDQYFLFEKGPKAFFNILGFPDVMIPTIGRKPDLLDHPRYKVDRMPKDQIKRIRLFFYEDIKLYQQVVKETYGYLCRTG